MQWEVDVLANIYSLCWCQLLLVRSRAQDNRKICQGGWAIAQTSLLTAWGSQRTLCVKERSEPGEMSCGCGLSLMHLYFRSALLESQNRKKVDVLLWREASVCREGSQLFHQTQNCTVKHWEMYCQLYIYRKHTYKDLERCNEWLCSSWIFRSAPQQVECSSETQGRVQRVLFRSYYSEPHVEKCEPGKQLPDWCKVLDQEYKRGLLNLFFVRM